MIQNIRYTLPFFILLLSANIIFAQVLPSARQDPLIDSQTLLQELKAKKIELDKREAEINAKEAKLKTLEESLIVRESDVKAMRKEVMDRIDDLAQKQDLEIDKMVKMYSSTKPKSAAKILVNMDIITSIAIFKRMPANSAGKILNELGKLDPVYASKIMEGLKPLQIKTPEPEPIQSE